MEVPAGRGSLFVKNYTSANVDTNTENMAFKRKFQFRKIATLPRVELVKIIPVRDVFIGIFKDLGHCNCT